VRVGLISDTHGQLRNQVFDVFAGVDLILHAGDIGDLDIISNLEVVAAVHAVHGNMDDFDVRAKHGESVSLELEGKRVIVVHGHLFGAPTPARLRSAFPTADVIVYGHTHMPLIDRRDGALIVNPGAAGPRRFKLQPSVALLELPQLEVQIVSL
jgi:putative phosphoesterase